MTAAPVVLPPLDGQQAQAWDTLMAVAADLGRGWTLIGGQMVLLHQAERSPAGAGAIGGAALRWSYDLDVVVNLRTSRSRMGRIDSVLKGHGFEQQVVPIGVEAFPAGQLHDWGLNHRGYAAGLTNPTRDSILEDLSQRIEIPDSLRRCCRSNPDALDAVLCVFAAKAAADELSTPHDPAAAASEGWIATHPDT